MRESKTTNAHVDELLEEELDAMLRDDETFHEIADALMDEVEKRFDLLPPEHRCAKSTRLAAYLEWRMAR